MSTVQDHHLRIYSVELSPDDLEGFCLNRLRGPNIEKRLRIFRKSRSVGRIPPWLTLMCFLHERCAFLYGLPLLEVTVVLVSIYVPRQVANSFLEFCRAAQHICRSLFEICTSEYYWAQLSERKGIGIQ